MHGIVCTGHHHNNTRNCLTVCDDVAEGQKCRDQKQEQKAHAQRERERPLNLLLLASTPLSFFGQRHTRGRGKVCGNAMRLFITIISNDCPTTLLLSALTSSSVQRTTDCPAYETVRLYRGAARGAPKTRSNESSIKRGSSVIIKRSVFQFATAKLEVRLLLRVCLGCSYCACCPLLLAFADRAAG